jgi:hypothetical protein
MTCCAPRRYLGLVDGVSLQLAFDPAAFRVAEATRFCGDAVMRYLARRTHERGRDRPGQGEGATLQDEGHLVAASAIHERIGDAFGALETFLEPIPAARGRPRGYSG